MSDRVPLELCRGWTERDGERIYWEFTTVSGDDDRPVAVLSHGAGGSHAVWFQQVPVLGERYRVLTWDARGFGNSTNVNDAPSAETAAADLTAVLDELELDRVHLVGQSMGGWHSSAFAAAAPSRVASIVYADTVGGLWTDELRAAFAEYSAQRGLASPPRLGGHPALWPGTAERDLPLAFLYDQLGSFHDPPMAALRNTLGYTIRHETVAALDVPVLFVAGEHDEIFPAGLLADSASRIERSTFVEIANAGHSPYFEQPDAWNAAVIEFLAGAA